MDKEEIEQSLQGLPREAVVALAARAALRLLPSLVTEQRDGQIGLLCWKPKDRARHLLTVFRACNSGFLPGVDKRYIADAARVAYSSDTAYAADAARAADAAACAARASRVADTTTFAARAILHFFRILPAAQVEFIQDLITIKSENPNQIFAQKLWYNPPPYKRHELQPFKSTVLQLNAGFEYWLDWYEARLAGEQLDMELQHQSIQIPPAIEEQGVAAINAYLQSLQKRIATAPLNRVRAIFIGYGDAGKTSLVRVLL